jgi:3-oxoacyl-[acyl-carrier-protein] synthase II
VTRSQIAITGVGLCSPLGAELEPTLAALLSGETGIRRFEGELEDAFFAGRLAPEVAERASTAAARSLDLRLFDRTGQLALWAARSALEDANLRIEDLQRSDRVALLLGTSHGGRSQLDAIVEAGGPNDEPNAAHTFLERAAHHVQTAAVAAALGAHGPALTFSSACGSSGVAIAYGMELLRAGRVDVAVVGGADAFSKLTLAGFSALGAVAPAPCAPFSSRVGMTLGEGSGMLVLERSTDAVARKARLRGELWGYGLSWDAYHATEPEPSGAGMGRALRAALSRAGVSAGEVDWFHAHGTGTRANDAAECLAIERQFGGAAVTVQVVSSKSFTGHTLGASSALGLIIATLCRERGMIPPTVNFKGPRAGCRLDFVPNTAQQKKARVVVVNAAAFGGANAVLVMAQPTPAEPVSLAQESVALAGIGCVTAFGLGVKALSDGLTQGRSAVTRVDGPSGSAGFAALVRNVDFRAALPTSDVRRADRVMQYAAVAAAEALRDAGLDELLRTPEGSERVGLVVATCRGAVTSYSKYLESVRGGRWKQASATHFPNLVMSSVGGFVSKSLGLRGIASTVVGGEAAGLSALFHAAELLRRDDSQDAVVVVAADQHDPLFYRLMQRAGQLAPVEVSCSSLYCAGSKGPLFGEGAAAVVLRRSSSLGATRPRALLAGYGMTHDAHPSLHAEPEGKWLAQCLQNALRDARLTPSKVDVVYGHASGDARHDARERRAFEAVFSNASPHLCAIAGGAGRLESASGLLGVVACCLGFSASSVFPVVSQNQPQPGLRYASERALSVQTQIALITASSADGANAAAVLHA